MSTVYKKQFFASLWQYSTKLRTMKDEIILSVLIFATCVVISQAQWTPDPFCPFPSDHVTRYPYYGNCSVYWECYEGTKYIMECPEGLEFNAPLQQCDTPSIANCDPFASTTENPNPPTYTTVSTTSHAPGPDCPFPSEEEIFFPYEGDCTKYWECYEGDHYLYNCPDGLWWHQAISQCDYPGDFCTNSTVTPTSPTTPPSAPTATTPPPPICDGSTTDQTFYPYPSDCTKYYVCTNGNLYVTDCPDGLWWDQAVGECEFPGDFCTDRTTRATPPTTFSDISTSTGDSASTPNPDDVTCPNPNDQAVYFPVSGDCTKYWECFEGVKYLNSCPSGEWWHQETQECEEPGDYC